jgi:hypothetical protein
MPTVKRPKDTEGKTQSITSLEPSAAPASVARPPDMTTITPYSTALSSFKIVVVSNDTIGHAEFISTRDTAPLEIPSTTPTLASVEPAETPSYAPAHRSDTTSFHLDSSEEASLSPPDAAPPDIA